MRHPRPIPGTDRLLFSALPSLDQGSHTQVASWLDSSVNSLIQTIGAVGILRREKYVECAGSVSQRIKNRSG